MTAVQTLRDPKPSFLRRQESRGSGLTFLCLDSRFRGNDDFRVSEQV